MTAKTEFCLWWCAMEEVLLEYEPFSDTEGQLFWLDWTNILIDQYRAEPGACQCKVEG